MSKNKGITLIALVVTIIVLLILAGISIATLTGTNGIITRANESREENVRGAEREQISLAYGTVKSFLLEKESTESVKAEDLENRLKTDGGKITSVEEEDGSLKVIFDTENVYYVDEEGNITDGEPAEPVNPPALGEVEEPQVSTEKEPVKNSGVIEIAWLDLNNNVIEKPLSPTLGNMEKVSWDTSSNEITPSTNSDWYDYDSNQWANAKNLEDGSYFVWIPRYAYKIIYFDNEKNKNAYIADNTSRTGITGYSTIYGIMNANGEVREGTQTNISNTVKTEGYRDYIPHPGFLGIGYENIGGGFGNNEKGIRGMWVAKYEMAREDSADNGETWTAVVTGGGADLKGNRATTNAGSSNYIRAVSKPGLTNWSLINIANCYENAYHYDRNKESHLMKNSEWGVVAYLTHSKYGINGAEIAKNTGGGKYYTGGGTGKAYKTNTNQSTTGNVYGIYDLSGNASEYLAGFNKLGNSAYFKGSNLSEKGTIFASYNGTSTKYATAYSNSSTKDQVNYNLGDMSYTGDAIREVKSTYYSLSWFGDWSSFLSYNSMFPLRGGAYDSSFAGLFYFSGIEGFENFNSRGFRVVLAK